MEFSAKTFKALTVDELFEIYKLRSEIFIVEQNCAYQDVDDLDKAAQHILLSENNILAAYARILSPGAVYKEPAIGRVVVKKEFRGKDLGKELMKFCLKYIIENYHNQQVVISAQSYLLRFYSDLGFVAEGPQYLEDNIPHTKMRYTPN